jgi:hypothetical protein
MLSKSAVSELTEGLQEDYVRFKQRSLEGFDVAYLFLDAVYEPVRRYGCRTGILCCWGYLVNGGKVLLDLTLTNGESEEAVVEFLRGMLRRGLRTPLTVTTDGAAGLIRAVERIWPLSLRLRCWFHKMQNLRSKVPKRPGRSSSSACWRSGTPLRRKKAEAALAELLEAYGERFAEACRCLQDDWQASVNHLRLPPRHQPYVRHDEPGGTHFRGRTPAHQNRAACVGRKESGETGLRRAHPRQRALQRPQFGDLEQTWILQLRHRILGEDPQVEVQSEKRKRRSASQRRLTCTGKLGLDP